MNKHIIVGVHITDRLENAVKVQQILTEYGGNIKTRLGLHEVTGTPNLNGLLLLEMVGDESRCLSILNRLSGVAGVFVQKMVFEHPA
jgi:hypothetical protein